MLLRQHSQDTVMKLAASSIATSLQEGARRSVKLNRAVIMLGKIPVEEPPHTSEPKSCHAFCNA